jgi:ubiquinone/menaquinone biosynthesis C-methylase UbiE
MTMPGAVRPLAGLDFSATNGEFYMSFHDSEKIMNPSSFSSEVREFLRDERISLGTMFVDEGYDCIVEVGCHDGHNAPWLAQLCGRYVGVDINEFAIRRAKQRDGNPNNADFFHAPVERVMSLLQSSDSAKTRTAVLFPFNLFGNFIDVVGLITRLDLRGVDLIMANFNDKAPTTIGRYLYYVNCFGSEGIRVYEAEQGVLFRAGQKFQSIAYKPDYLSSVIRKISNYHGILTPFSRYGYLFILTK